MGCLWFVFLAETTFKIIAYGSTKRKKAQKTVCLLLSLGLAYTYVTGGCFFPTADLLFFTIKSHV